MEGFFSGLPFYLPFFGAYLLVILPGEIIQRQTLKKKGTSVFTGAPNEESWHSFSTVMWKNQGKPLVIASKNS